MGILTGCGYFCLCISLWGIVQLNIMGICFKMEMYSFLEEAEPEEADDVEEFLHKTKNNYSEISLNCYYAAALYCVTLFLSFVCIFVADRKARVKTEIESDDELNCNINPIAPEVKKDPRDNEAPAFDAMEEEYYRHDLPVFS